MSSTYCKPSNGYIYVSSGSINNSGSSNSTWPKLAYNGWVYQSNGTISVPNSEGSNSSNTTYSAQSGTGYLRHVNGALSVATVPYKFQNYNGDSLQTGTVAPFSTPSYSGSTPTRSADICYTYTFSGWSPSVGPISSTSTTTYTAQFSKTGKTISVSNDTTGGMSTRVWRSSGYYYHYDDDSDIWIDNSHYEVSAKDTIFGYSTSAPMKITLTYNMGALYAYMTFEWRGIFLNVYVSNDGINYTEYGQIASDGGSGTDKLYFSGSSTISGYCYVKVSFNINNSSYGILAAQADHTDTLTASIEFI